MTSDFNLVLQSAVSAACAEWTYPEPGESWHLELKRRIPLGVRELFGHGLEIGVLKMVDGFRFTMTDLPHGKGPYALLSRSPTKIPSFNWEYVVQAVDYVRAHSLLAKQGYRIGVEDNLMDVTVRDSAGDLLWYIESKESAAELLTLVSEIKNWGRVGVDLSLPDRGKDGLRKAKYIVQHRPRYFSGSAIGMRLDFSVTYTSENQFALQEDVIPLG